MQSFLLNRYWIACDFLCSHWGHHQQQGALKWSASVCLRSSPTLQNARGICRCTAGLQHMTVIINVINIGISLHRDGSTVRRQNVPVLAWNAVDVPRIARRCLEWRVSQRDGLLQPVHSTAPAVAPRLLYKLMMCQIKLKTTGKYECEQLQAAIVSLRLQCRVLQHACFLLCLELQSLKRLLRLLLLLYPLLERVGISLLHDHMNEGARWWSLSHNNLMRLWSVLIREETTKYHLSGLRALQDSTLFMAHHFQNENRAAHAVAFLLELTARWCMIHVDNQFIAESPIHLIVSCTQHTSPNNTL